MLGTCFSPACLRPAPAHAKQHQICQRFARHVPQGVVTKVAQPEPGAGGYPTATIQMTDIMERGRTKVSHGVEF